MSDEPLGLRERTRRAVQSEIATVALELFLADGYEATTIEHIAAAAGFSRRSFFRYFSGKDEILAHTLASTGEKLVQSVQDRLESEPIWAALRAGMQPMIDQIQADPRSLQLTRMMLVGDALQASTGFKQREWVSALAVAVAPRLADELPPTERPVAAHALAGAAIAALNAAELEWVNRDGRASLTRLLDLAMASVAHIRDPQALAETGTSPSIPE